MALSDTTTTELGVVDKSSTWSSTALSAASETMLALRVTSVNISADPQTARSEELDSNGQTTEIRRTLNGASGDIGFEYSFPPASGGLRLMIESMFRSTFATLAESQTDISFTSTSTIASAAAADFSSLVAGQKIRVGSTSGTNDGIYTVSSATTLSITVVETTISTESAGTAGTVTVDACMIRNGVSPKYVAIEEDKGEANKFFHSPANQITGMTLTANDASIINGSFSLLGAGWFNTAATVDSDGTYASAGTNSVYDTSNDVNTILEGGAANSNLHVKNFSLNLVNNARSQSVCSNTRYIGVGQGEFQVTGSMEAYFADNSIFTKFENDTATSFSFQMGTAVGGSMIVTVQNMKYTTCSIPSGGKNTDVMATYGFEGQKHATYNCIVQIDLV